MVKGAQSGTIVGQTFWHEIWALRRPAPSGPIKGIDLAQTITTPARAPLVPRRTFLVGYSFESLVSVVVCHERASTTYMRCVVKGVQRDEW